jgi:hypothetical protein
VPKRAVVVFRTTYDKNGNRLAQTGAVNATYNHPKSGSMLLSNKLTSATGSAARNMTDDAMGKSGSTVAPSGTTGREVGPPRPTLMMSAVTLRALRRVVTTPRVSESRRASSAAMLCHICLMKPGMLMTVRPDHMHKRTQSVDLCA